MSLGGLVAYDSSDESEEEVNTENDTNNIENGGESVEKTGETQKTLINENLLFNSLPKPRTFEKTPEIDEFPGKKEKGPVKISIPSLSEFKDVDEEMQQKKKKIQPSMTGTGLFSVLPPPSSSLRSSTTLVPQILKKPQPPKAIVPTQLKKPTKPLQNPAKSALSSIKYDSNSEDEEEEKSTVSKTPLDFFSLSKSSEIVIPEETMAIHMLPAPVERKPMDSDENSQTIDENQTLTSTVMNLPRDEIILKNKAEVGPKLPVPEQEYHVDAAGNVAFDEKAIEYLCGKRGVKRKNELIQGANIIDINGEDIKPDEREWLVKALTEEQVQRPVSLSAGPSGASKKKHQITYLAHQAKAMELELQNQWAANRLSRKQTKSKYGF